MHYNSLTWFQWKYESTDKNSYRRLANTAELTSFDKMTDRKILRHIHKYYMIHTST